MLIEIVQCADFLFSLYLYSNPRYNSNIISTNEKSFVFFFHSAFPVHFLFHIQTKNTKEKNRMLNLSSTEIPADCSEIKIVVGETISHLMRECIT